MDGKLDPSAKDRPSPVGERHVGSAARPNGTGRAVPERTQAGTWGPAAAWAAFQRLTRFNLSPINRRRVDNFRASSRGLWSLRLFLALFCVTLCAELIANERPLLVRYKGELLFPILKDYPESKFDGFLPTTSYRDPTIQNEILEHGWIV